MIFKQNNYKYKFVSIHFFVILIIELEKLKKCKLIPIGHFSTLMRHVKGLNYQIQIFTESLFSIS